MIDISINKIFTLVTGISVASLSLFEMVLPGNTADRTHENVKAVIEKFIKAGDKCDGTQLNELLHSNFRVVANQLMGGTDVTIITKEQYLSLIRDGKLGGDERTYEILSLEVVNKNASAHVRIKGKVLSFDTFYHLIQLPEGIWQLVQDLPHATKN